jgi:peroxiredoxin
MKWRKVFVVGFFLLSISILAQAEVKVGEIAPDFNLNDTEGNAIKLSSYKDNNVVILDFFTTWCPTCITYLSEINSCYGAYKDKGLIVIGVDIEESIAKVKKLVKKHKLDYPVVLDLKAETAKDYGVRGVPYMVIIDKTGRIAWTGHILDNKGRAKLKELLN